MNTVLTYVIMCLICRFKAPGGGFRNLKFDLLYKCMYIHKACSFKNLKFPTGLSFRQKLIYLTVCLSQTNPGFRKNSVCSLIWPDFDSFESAN